MAVKHCAVTATAERIARDDTDAGVAVATKRDLKVAHVRVFLTTAGSLDVRNQSAVLDTADLDSAAELVEAVRAARELIRTLRDRLDVEN